MQVRRQISHPNATLQHQHFPKQNGTIHPLTGLPCYSRVRFHWFNYLPLSGVHNIAIRHLMQSNFQVFL